MSLVYRTDVERGMPPILRDVLGGRGWEEYDEETPAAEQPPFSLFWRTNRFTASQIASAKYPHQRINHYPKSSEITKKDHLHRHLRRMRVVHGSCYDFSPITFGLPNDYVKFCQYFAGEKEKWEAAVEERKRRERKGEDPKTLPQVDAHPPTYICKPSDSSRGRKIFVFRDVAELTYDCSSVVQRYIDKPLLVHGHKVDFRVYVLVTSFQPLRAYIYDDLLARFSVEKYDLSDTANIFCHLTNYSVNKNSSIFEQHKAGIGTGCKWHGAQIREYFEAMGIDWSVMWRRVEVLVCYTLLSIAAVVPPVPQCFELYGFDIMFDETFKPWLIEVNFSPALAVESDTDDVVKRGLMTDMIDTLNIPPPGEEPERRADSWFAAGAAAATTASPATSGVSSSSQPAPSSSRRTSGAAGSDRDGDESAPPVAPERKTSAPRANGKAAAPAAPARGAKSVRGVPAGGGAKLGPSGRPTAGSATKRSSSSKPVASAASSVTARRAGPSAPAPAPPTGVEYVDAPRGKFRWCFPFSAQTESLIRGLCRKDAAAEQIIRQSIAEVKKREAKVVAEMAGFGAEYRRRVATAAADAAAQFAPVARAPAPARVNGATKGAPARHAAADASDDDCDGDESFGDEASAAAVFASARAR